MVKSEPIDEEYTFDTGIGVSSTDLSGVITYANRKFCEISGYGKSELIGKNHNIVRHPYMPKMAFKQLWDTLDAEKEWTGIIKNLRKDGRYFWVYSHITPIFQNGKKIGYSSVKRPASATEINEIISHYKEMLEQEK
ncbi:MAG TPA: PAS domain S-box protein [Epsilonproteobacteria bacterium]|nr:PAS domain S-box protein [Campylobacterota bacterium]